MKRFFKPYYYMIVTIGFALFYQYVIQADIRLEKVSLAFILIIVLLESYRYQDMNNAAMSLSASVIILSFIVFNQGVPMIAVSIAYTVAILKESGLKGIEIREHVEKLSFNIAQFTICITISANVYHYLNIDLHNPNDILKIFVVILVYHFINMLLMTLVITFHTGIFFKEGVSLSIQKNYLFYALTLTPILIYTYTDRKLMGVALFFMITLPLQKVSHLHLKLKTQEEELLRDHLTKAYNYRFFENVIDNRLGKGQSFSLVMMDIDKFKQINDTHGHVAGNIVLQEFSKVIMSVLPSSASLFRYGGDEFCILARSQDEASAIINNLLNRFKGFYVNYNYQKITVGLSMGVCHHNGEATVEEIIEKADQAMYLAKLKSKDNNPKIVNREIAL